MKRLSNHQFLIALNACLLLSMGSPALADEAADAPDTSKWVCKFCPISGGWFGDFDLGVIYVDDPTPKFADYRGMLDDDFYLEAGGDIGFRGENGHYFDFHGRNLGLDSRALEMRGGKQGTYELRADYSEIPRYLGYGTVTPYLGVGSDTLTLPDSWDPLDPTAESFAPAALESKRKTIGAGFTFRMGSSWKFNADVERQTRDGTRTFGGGVFSTNGVIFPAPIDYTTNLFNTGLEYSGNRTHVRLELIGSDFENGNRSVTWDNPYGGRLGDDVSRSALEPDNEFYQVSLIGAFNFSRRFRLSGKVSVGEMEQDVDFLPYSINPKFDDLELPRSSLNGKIDTSILNLAGRMYIVLADRLDLTAQYKVNERDNKTPVDFYTPILLEVFKMGEISNRPYGYDRTQGQVVLRYRPTYKIRLNAGAKRDTLERTYQDVLETEEDTFWGEVQFTAWSWLGARLKLDSASREAEPFEEQGNFFRVENPLMRKFNMADRDRDRVTAELDLTPTEYMDIVFSYYTTEDDYSNSLVGLTDSEENSFNVNFNYILGKDTNLYAFYSADTIESNQSTADGVGAIPWTATMEDEIETWGLGISGRINDKFSYGLDYVSSDSDGETLTDNGNGEGPFPVLTTKFTNARIYLNYKVSDRWGLGLDAYREEYESTDWYIDGLGPTGINGVLTMGGYSPEYEVNVVRLLTTISF
jgi:MtrB/PioB family decaheme-associated outer membrane protein